MIQGTDNVGGFRHSKFCFRPDYVLSWNLSCFSSFFVTGDKTPLKDASTVSVANRKSGLLLFHYCHFVTADISHMSFSNPLELCLLVWICWCQSPSALVFVDSTEHKIGLLNSMAIHTKCNACATDHVIIFITSSHSIFSYIVTKSWSQEGVGTSLPALFSTV